MKDLKLNKLAENQLNNGNLSRINGGEVVGEPPVIQIVVCGCGCMYEGQEGGSSTNANGNANARLQTYSVGMPRDLQHNFPIIL